MRRPLAVFAALILCGFSIAQDQYTAPPKEFEIGRHTFFDFGPPFDFYEVFLVRPAVNRTSIERIMLTPAADTCTQPAKVEVAIGALSAPVAELLGKTNPCTIPEKELRREQKRCRKCLVFSGANVAMQVQCGNAVRIIRADILDRDMFDPAPNTPEHTSWTMQLLGRIDQAVGKGVMDRPMFPIADEEKAASTQDEEIVRSIGDGKYDDLFKGAPDKPSDLYRGAQVRAPSPSIRLISSAPFQPLDFIQPGYPPIAKLARIDGTVTFMIDVDRDGIVTNFTVQSGHPMLRGATEKAVNNWKFPKEAAGHRIQATIEFATNCPPKK
jgi:TonB family protein